MICRDTYDHAKSHYDAPLSSRYEEMDAVVIFKDVFVPWERVFIYREPDLCNRAFAQNHAVTQMMHQVHVYANLMILMMIYHHVMII